MEDLKTKNLDLQDKNIVIALSGGIDSVVLLHYIHSYFPNNLRAIHCNHNLSKHCVEWDNFCKNLCRTLNIKYKAISISIKTKTNIEAEARKERYQALALNLKKHEILCTAHHKNDQIETLLLQLLRGSGVAGLAAMPLKKPFGNGFLYRPLLNISKQQIINYAKNHNLVWVEDNSNKDTNFRRNFLRLKLIPQLSKVYQNLEKSLFRSTKHQAEALKLNQELAIIDINKHSLVNGDNLNIKGLIDLKTHRIKNIIRHHINSINFLHPSAKITQQIINLLHAKQDANPLVCWGQYQIRRYNNVMYFIDSKKEEIINFCPFYEKLKNSENFSINYKKNGQRVKLQSKKHSQSLKKILQQANIPPWERNKVRMYYVNDKLIAIEHIGKATQA